MKERLLSCTGHTAKGQLKLLLYIRRMLILLALGYIHQQYQSGEALFLYTIIGLVVIPLYWAPRTVNLVVLISRSPLNNPKTIHTRLKGNGPSFLLKQLYLLLKLQMTHLFLCKIANPRQLQPFPLQAGDDHDEPDHYTEQG